MAQTSQVQESLGEGLITISGAVVTGQRGAEVRGRGFVRESGIARTTQRAQHAKATGRMVIRGSASTSTAPQSTRAHGFAQPPQQFRPVLEKMLRYPHQAVFDKSPSARPAIRFADYDGQLAWMISGEVLEVVLNGSSRFFGLRDVTVFELVERMRQSGVNAAVVDSEFSQLSAMVLLDEGGRRRSDYDSIQAFTSLLWALFYAFANQVAEQRYQVAEALKQMIIDQAEGVWLDLWGTLYGVEREPGEADARYAPRIAREAFRARLSPIAIEEAIKDQTGWDVRIEEPWKEIFRLDHSLLSGPDKFYDGATIGYHLIRPVARDSVDWVRVLRIIDRNRAAGVLLANADSRRTSSVSAGGEYPVSYGIQRQHIELTPHEDRVYLDFSRIGDVPVLNHKAQHLRVDVVFRGTLVQYRDIETLDNSAIEESSVANNPAIFTRLRRATSLASLLSSPSASYVHVRKDENEYHRSFVVYEDRLLLDQSQIEADWVPVLPAALRREILRPSESFYTGQDWNLPLTWQTAEAAWPELREYVEVLHSRSS